MLPWNFLVVALVLYETNNEESLSAAAAPVVSCFDDNGWRHLIGTVKDLKENIQQEIIFYVAMWWFYK